MEVRMPDIIASRLYLTGQWEAMTTSYVRANLRPGDTFIDVGANIGYYSVMASRLVGENGKVFALEASGDIFSLLSRNLEINGSRNVTAINAAVSDSIGERPIFLSGESNRGQTTTVSSVASRRGFTFGGTVRADTLENLVGTETLMNSRLIKVDVEGAERAVLEPLLRSLGKFSPQTEWLLELSSELSERGRSDIDPITRAFAETGYRAFAIENPYEASFLRVAPEGLRPIRPEEVGELEQCDVLMTRR